MSGAREEGAATLRLSSGDGLPLWDHLLAELGHHDTRINAGFDAPPVMLGRFEVRRRVGGGGMGTVFEAIDTGLGRRVALKICTHGGIDAVTAIEHEARCLARLAHPNVVGIHEVVRYGVDVILVMEFVQGRTLAQWQRATKPAWGDVLDRYLDAGRGLAAVHATGLVHGDFKPENVMLGDDGRVRVVDFGIARYSSSSRFDVSNMGTRSYMAPERLMEKPGGPLADIYAFCVSVWESLFGVLPFNGKTVPDLLNSIEAGGPARGRALPGVPETVRGVLRKGLAASPSDRPQSMEAFIRALDDAREGHRRRVVRAASWVGGGLAVVLVVASGVMAWKLATAIEPPQVEHSESTSTTSQAVETTLGLAVESAEHGDGPTALKYLEAGRLRAARDFDSEATRLVADEAIHVGDRLAEQGNIAWAAKCWMLGHEIFYALDDREGTERVVEIMGRWGVSSHDPNK